MTFEQIMHLQYRKLLQARDIIHSNMIAQIEAGEPLQLYPVFILSPLLTDLDSFDYPELTPDQNERVLRVLRLIEETEEAGSDEPLTFDDILDVWAIRETNRLPDDLNRRVALPFTDAANEVLPGLFIGREALEEIL